MRRIACYRSCGALLFVFAFLQNLPNAFAAELVLRDEQLAQTATGRKELKYLVSCAMPRDTTVVAVVGRHRYAFAGDMALAPAWSTRALTPDEQRRVSACMLARTNFYGKPVRISIRSDAPDAPASLKTDEAERKDFPFWEAGFFGNLFTDQPEGYVCTGVSTPDRTRHLESLLRVCSLPMSGTDAQANVSRCYFIMVGPCSEHNFLQNGVDYSRSVLSVYLPKSPKK